MISNMMWSNEFFILSIFVCCKVDKSLAHFYIIESFKNDGNKKKLLIKVVQSSLIFRQENYFQRAKVNLKLLITYDTFHAMVVLVSNSTTFLKVGSNVLFDIFDENDQPNKYVFIKTD